MFKVKKGFTVIEIAIVVAIIAIIAGVWYVSKSKTGADVKMPGIGTTGTPPTGGSTTPPKMGMGRIKGQVTDKAGNPVMGTRVTFLQGTCSNNSTSSGGGKMWYGGSTDLKGYYSIVGVQPSSYCGYAVSTWATDKVSWVFDKDINVSFGGTTTLDFKLSNEAAD